MSQPRAIVPQLLVVACFSRHDAALDWARNRLETAFGPIVLTSQPYAFVQTDYYAPSMGAGLHKLFHVFGGLVDPATLASIKLRTIALERELASAGTFPDSRPLNLDPGLLSLGKFCLATTKDQSHRIFLRDGVFAEVTLRFQDGAFHPWPWTYADYRLPEVLAFLAKARDLYRTLGGRTL